MPHNTSSFRYRGMAALHALVGGARQEISIDRRDAFDLPDAGLIIMAGDDKVALDPGRLRPLAMARGRSVLATWADPILSGHRVLIDAVLYDAGTATAYPEYRLWLQDDGVAALVPEAGDGPALAIGASGLRLLDRQPFADTVGRTTGIARGQAWLHARLYAGTPFASPALGSVSR